MDLVGFRVVMLMVVSFASAPATFGERRSRSRAAAAVANLKLLHSRCQRSKCAHAYSKPRTVRAIRAGSAVILWGGAAHTASLPTRWMS